MKLLGTIYRQDNINIEGKTFLREAVRGIIFRDKKLLMIYSPVNGDYKFPGGGIEPGEPHIETLRRELLEEAGATLSQVTGEFGKTIEYANAFDEGFSTYKQISYYYFCDVDVESGLLDLDKYEAELGFQPVWIKIEDTLETNMAVLKKSNPAPRWTKREIFILEKLKEILA
jgi:8-oxo-dGTP diphosphatase